MIIYKKMPNENSSLVYFSRCGLAKQMITIAAQKDFHPITQRYFDVRHRVNRHSRTSYPSPLHTMVQGFSKDLRTLSHYDSTDISVPIPESLHRPE